MSDVMKGFEMRVIELFAGCGGLALGLHRSGWKGLFAVERDPMAFETLSKNMILQGAAFEGFKEWPEWLPLKNLDLISLLGDPQMREHLRDLAGSIDMVAGGPPCQGFSVAGRRDGTDDRNSLVFKMLEFVSLVKPRAVMIENVEGIARRFVSKPGQAKHSVADEVIELLDELGYSAAYHVLDARDFGVPQARKRVVIFAASRAPGLSEGVATVFERELRNAAVTVRKKYGLPVDRYVTASEALDDLASDTRIPCPDSPGFEAGTYRESKSRYSQIMRDGVPEGAHPNSHRFSKHGERVSSLYQLAHATQKPGRLSKEFLLNNGTKKDKKVLMDPDAVASTITTHPDEFIHYLYPRNLTVREMARLQSFPDVFHFYGRYTINGPRRRFDVARCSQVGNAVPPLMGEGLGLAARNVLEGMTSLNRRSLVAPRHDGKVLVEA